MQRGAPSSPPAPLFKKAKTADDVELDDDEVAELLEDIEEEAEEVEGLDYSPNTARAGGYKDPLVCVNCGLEGRVCVFSKDKRTNRRKAACDYCVQAHDTCRKVNFIFSDVLSLSLTYSRLPAKPSTPSPSTRRSPASLPTRTSFSALLKASATTSFAAETCPAPLSYRLIPVIRLSLATMSSGAIMRRRLPRSPGVLVLKSSSPAVLLSPWRSLSSS